MKSPEKSIQSEHEKKCRPCLIVALYIKKRRSMLAILIDITGGHIATEYNQRISQATWLMIDRGVYIIFVQADIGMEDETAIALYNKAPQFASLHIFRR